MFLGGATVELWITDEAAPEFRATVDVDVIVEVATRSEYYRFEKRIRAAGFRNDHESRVICRFRHPESELVLDVMPTEASVLGFQNRWQKEAFPHATPVSLPGGEQIRVIPPSFLIATKLEAFSTRGNGDFLASRDFADLIALVDGREELVDDMAMASDALQVFVGEQLLGLGRHPDFERGLEGALSATPDSPARVERVLWPRLRRLMVAGAVSG